MKFTNEQIAKLTGDALAEAVATAMQPKPSSRPIVHDPRRITWWEWIPGNDGLDWQWRSRGLDWNAAGMLLAEIKRRGWRWQINPDLYDSDRIAASVNTGGADEIYVTGDDAPTAAARLFMLVMVKEGS